MLGQSFTRDIAKIEFPKGLETEGCQELSGNVISGFDSGIHAIGFVDLRQKMDCRPRTPIRGRQ